MSLSGGEFLAFLSQPRVAASFWQVTDSKLLLTMQKDGLEIAEIRLDMAATCDYDSALELIAVYKSLPTILTIRTEEEGGQWHGDEETRCELFLKLLPSVSAVDVELSSPILSRIVDAAKKKERAVIVSRHNFSTADTFDNLNAAAQNAFDSGADVFKTACVVENEEELQILHDFLQEWKLRRVVVIGMGESEISRRARLELPREGSCIAFAAALDKSAPGQLSLQETISAIIGVNN